MTDAICEMAAEKVRRQKQTHEARWQKSSRQRSRRQRANCKKAMRQEGRETECESKKA